MCVDVWYSHIKDSHDKWKQKTGTHKSYHEMTWKSGHMCPTYFGNYAVSKIKIDIIFFNNVKIWKLKGTSTHFFVWEECCLFIIKEPTTPCELLCFQSLETLLLAPRSHPPTLNIMNKYFCVIWVPECLQTLASKQPHFGPKLFLHCNISQDQASAEVNYKLPVTQQSTPYTLNFKYIFKWLRSSLN